MTNSDWIAGVALWREAWWSGFASVGTIFLLQYVGYFMLLYMSPAARTIRRAVLPLAMFYFWLDLLLNTRYTLGTKLRDSKIGMTLWFAFLAIITTAFTFNDGPTGERIPRWCVPDWEREEQDRGLQTTETDKYKAISPSWWRRAAIPARPEWARKQRIVPRHWRLLPYPTSLPDRLLWALDVMMFYRHGTSLVFAQEMRALDWSKSQLALVGEAHLKARQAGLSYPPHSSRILPFGYVDTQWPYALASTMLWTTTMVYMSRVDFVTSSAADFYRLPWKDQLMLTVSAGTSISMSTSFLEVILLPLLQDWPFFIPPTALKPTFRSVIQSKSITEIWQFRWHMFAKRGLVRFANMLPPYGEEWQRNMIMQTLKVFFCSGIMHSIFFVRAYPTPTWHDPRSIIGIFFRRYSMLFFCSQGALIVIEHAFPRLFLEHTEPDSRAAKWAPYARNVWTLIVFGLTGHWLAVEVAVAGMWTEENLHSLYPVNEAKDYFAVLHEHLSDGIAAH